MIKKVVFFGLISLLLVNCKSTQLAKKLTRTFDTSFYDNQFTGLLIYNPATKDTVVSYNADRYFTPASNTKISTLFTALKMLPNKIPAFKYAIEKDTITLLGTGNPAFLHTFFNDSTALQMAKKYQKIKLIVTNFIGDKFAPGWAWEDYDRYFSTERNAFPIYGNVLTVYNVADGLQKIPTKMNATLTSDKKFRRKYNENVFYYPSKRKDTLEIPMVINTELITKLWTDLLPNKNIEITKRHPKEMKTFYSIPSDSLYKRMMQVSDNFLAEQILIMASSTLSDTLSSKKVRKYVLKNYLSDLKQQPRWVDGSGLSRYNLFTPTSFVQILEKMYTEIPRERLFNFFPVGGVTGTLEKWYPGNPTPYIYAKTGTVGNNHSVSGYLVTNSGKILIFSFMNNHFRKSTSKVKQKMQTVFEWLRDNY